MHDPIWVSVISNISPRSYNINCRENNTIFMNPPVLFSKTYSLETTWVCQCLVINSVILDKLWCPEGTSLIDVIIDMYIQVGELGPVKISMGDEKWDDLVLSSSCWLHHLFVLQYYYEQDNLALHELDFFFIYH